MSYLSDIYLTVLLVRGWGAEGIKKRRKWREKKN